MINASLKLRIGIYVIIYLLPFAIVGAIIGGGSGVCLGICIWYYKSKKITMTQDEEREQDARIKTIETETERKIAGIDREIEEICTGKLTTKFIPPYEYNPRPVSFFHFIIWLGLVGTLLSLFGLVKFMIYFWQVEVRNDPPEIISFSPSQTSLVIYVGDSLIFEVEAQDPDEDRLSYRWSWDGNIYSHKNSKISIQPRKEHIGFHTFTVTVHDGKHSVSHSWQVEVRNNPPKIISFSPQV